jgi:gliding-associated putative ABC transporter substrate-binding component GldG
MTRRKILLPLLIAGSILVMVNVASYFFFFRLDFTADKQFTLSDATRTTLKNLNSKVVIKAYFSEDLPIQLLKARQDVEDLLVEYAKRSNGNLSFEFVNPNENSAAEEFAQTQGIRPVMVNVAERDQASQLRAYMGATIETGNQKEVIPMIQPGESPEYSLTTAIKKMVVKEKPTIAFLQGHDEYPSSALHQVTEQLNIVYDVKNYTITDTTEIPLTFKTLVIIDPKDSIPPAHLEKFDRYLQSGGNVLLAYSSIYGNLQTPFIQPVPEIGLQGWLAKRGIAVREEVVVDAQCRRVVKQEQQGPFVFNRQIRFPYFPIIKNFEDHPVTKGIEAVFFPFISPIIITSKNDSINVVPLAASSKKSGLIKIPAVIDINKEWAANEFSSGPQILAVAIEQVHTKGTRSKMIVVPNGKFSVNTEAGQEELNADNVSLTSNAIDWLSDDTGLIELRTKGVSYRPLDPLEDATREMVKYGNTLIPVMIILFVSGIRRLANARKRRALQASSY